MTFERDSAHRDHDPLLIASHASQDLAPSDAERVERWLKDCSTCADLHADLLTLTGALSTLPKTATAPRDFRLSPAQAARLRGGPWWRRLGRALAAPRGAGRPLATAFTTLGLVGLLIGSLPAGALVLDSAAERALTQGSPDAAWIPAPAAHPSPTDTTFGAIDQHSPDDRNAYTTGSGSAGGGTTVETPKNDHVTITQAPDLAPGVGSASGATAGSTVRPVVALAIVFLAVGLGLFGIRRFGRKLA